MLLAPCAFPLPTPTPDSHSLLLIYIPVLPPPASRLSSSFIYPFNRLSHLLCISSSLSFLPPPPPLSLSPPLRLTFLLVTLITPPSPFYSAPSPLPLFLYHCCSPCVFSFSFSHLVLLAPSRIPPPPLLPHCSRLSVLSFLPLFPPLNCLPLSLLPFFCFSPSYLLSLVPLACVFPHRSSHFPSQTLPHPHPHLTPSVSSSYYPLQNPFIRPSLLFSPFPFPFPPHISHPH